MLLVSCSDRKPQLNILTFRDYIDPQVIKAFENTFDCRVSIDFVDNGDSIDAKIAAGAATTYDIVTMSDVRSFSQLGLLAPLKLQSIPNLVNIDPRFDIVSFSQGVRYSIPYSWGAMGIYVRNDKTQLIEESWSLLFDPHHQFGSFFLLNDHRTTIGAALRYRGYSVNSTNFAEIAEARKLVRDAKQRASGFVDVTAAEQRVLSKEAKVTMSYSGISLAFTKEDPETRFFIPREGSCMVLDGMSILSKAKQEQLAEKFLNYILDPKVGAQIANYLHCATPNKAALEFILPEDLKNPSIYPPTEVLSRLEVPRYLGEANKLYDELWTQIKAK